MSKILLKNGTIVHHDRIEKNDILIHDEKIKQVGHDLSENLADEIIDCAHKQIFPGIIDAHTHMGIPIKSGYSADNFESGSISALHGGVTTIIDFTILEAGKSLDDSVQSRKAKAANCYCDYAFHVNLTRYEKSLLEEILELIRQGIKSFKVFTTYKEAGMMLTYSQIREIAGIIKANDGLLMVHAEDDQIISIATSEIKDKNSSDPFLHGISRPIEAEVQAIKNLGEIAQETGCNIYIVHLSSGAGLKEAVKYPNLIIETCPQYLLLDEEYYKRHDGNMYVASPPLRSSEDHAGLWQGITENKISVIGTDHCPFNKSDKQACISFLDIPNGLGGVETLFPVLVSQFIKRKITLTLISQLLSYNPAHIFGLAGLKGQIRNGYDADLAIVDLNKKSTDWNKDLQSITDWNAYTNFPAIFPQYVFRRGEVVVKNYEMNLGSRGKYIF